MDNAVILSDDHSHLMARMMDLAQQRQQVIAHNLSNANTPGYIRQDIDFRGQLADILRNGTLKDPTAEPPEVIEDDANPARLDGNNVQISKEMNHMMQNGLMYELLTRAYTARTSILRMAITGAKA